MKINKLLEKYKLTHTFETKINVEKEIFIDKLTKVTEKGYYSGIFAIFDIFVSKDKKYIGNINNKNLKIREKINPKIFRISNTAKVKAEYNTTNNELQIRTKIIGMGTLSFLLISIIFILYSLIMLVAILEILLMLFSSDSKHIDSDMLSGYVLLTFIVFFFAYLPYYIGKNNAVKMKTKIQALYQQIEKTP